MAITKKTSAEEFTPEVKTVLPEGWYQVIFQKTEAKQSKSTQDMLTYQAKVLSTENDPTSAGNPILFGMVMLPSWDDDEAFRASIVAKKNVAGDELENEIKKRERMAEEGAAQFAYAVLGYDEFPPVPRKDKASGQYLLPNGTEVPDNNERQTMYDARKLAAFNATCEIALGERDITKYVAYAYLEVDTYNGEQKNIIKKLKPFLPDGEELQVAPF